MSKIVRTQTRGVSNVWAADLLVTFRTDCGSWKTSISSIYLNGPPGPSMI